MVRYTAWRALGSEKVQMSWQHLRGSETGRDSSREDHPRGRPGDGSFFLVNNFRCTTSKIYSCIIFKSVLIYTCPEGQEKEKR